MAIENLDFERRPQAFGSRLRPLLRLVPKISARKPAEQSSVLPENQGMLSIQSDVLRERVSENGGSDSSLVEYLLRVTYAAYGKKGAGVYAGREIHEAKPFEVTYAANRLKQVVDNAGFLMIRRMAAQELGLSEMEVKGLSYEKRKGKFVVRNGEYVRLSGAAERGAISKTFSAYVPQTDAVKDSIFTSLQLHSSADFESSSAEHDRAILALALKARPVEGKTQPHLSREHLEAVVKKARSQGVTSFEDTLNLAAYDLYSELLQVRSAVKKTEEFLFDPAFVASLDSPVAPVAKTRPALLSEQSVPLQSENEHSEKLNAFLLARGLASEKALQVAREYSIPMILIRLGQHAYKKVTERTVSKPAVKLPGMFDPETLAKFTYPPIRDEYSP